MGISGFLPFALLIGLLTGLMGKSSGQESCHPGNVEQCTAPIGSIYGFQEKVTASNETEIQALCRYTQDAMDCINMYVVRCLDAPHRDLYHELTGGLQDFIAEFCDQDSEFSIEYRKHLDCYNNLTQDFKTCSTHMASAQLQVETNVMSPQEASRVICCKYDQTVACFRALTLQRCSSEAASFVDIIFAKLLANATRKLRCELYSHGGPECHSTVNSRSPGLFGRLSLVLLAAAAATWWRARLWRRDLESPTSDV